MTISLHDVVKWVDEEFPKPRVDPEWLQGCYTWLTETEQALTLRGNFEKLLKAVANQIFRSNLSSSMLPGTGLPIDVNKTNYSAILKGSIFVEIIALTEISHSPFDLNRVRLEREEWVKRPRNGGMEDEEEGPIPKYPRGMLKFHLSDGTTILPAIEYRPLPELALEYTKLGFKLWLKNVRVNRGIAFLEPKTVALVGYETEEREENRETDFVRWLHEQMGLPPPHTGDAPVTPRDQATTQDLRPPLQDVSPPPMMTIQHSNIDEGLESRRRRIPNHDANLYPRPSSTAAEIPSSKATISSYFADPTAPGPSSTRIVVGGESIIFSPTLRQTRPSSSVPDEFLTNSDRVQTLLTQDLRRPNNDSVVSSTGGQMDVDEPRHHRASPSSSDFGDPQIDAETLAAIEAVEEAAKKTIITIDDSDEEDKENSPIPIRHVRRRMNNTATQESVGRERSMNPTSDIIDIQDSD